MAADGDATMLEAPEHSHVDDDGIKAFLLWQYCTLGFHQSS
jgi:hypothetical protein